MLTYCLKCKRNTKNVDSKMLETGRLMLLSKCAVCGRKKYRFIIKKQKDCYLT